MIRPKGRTAVFATVLLIVELLAPISAAALGGGPDQPEFSGFEPVGTSDMVDLFTGDFVYNLPLLDVGGYPLNLSYHSGISMDQEASWTGLGWSLNPGAINRGMRGIPDDFRCDDQGDPRRCDEITKIFNMRPNDTWGAKLDGSVEFVGKPGLEKATRIFTPGLSSGFGIFYNNYRGLGFERSVNASLSAAKGGFALSGVLGLNANSQQGFDVSPGLGLSYETGLGDDSVISLGLRAGSSYNSRAGLKALSLGTSLSLGQVYKDTAQRRRQHGKQTAFSQNGGATLPLNPQSYVPQITLPMETVSTTVHVGVGSEIKWLNVKGKLTGYHTRQELRTKRQSQPAYGYLYLDRGQDNPLAVLDFNREKDGAFTTETPGLPLARLTYDSYTVTGQGIGGMYRPFRSDVGRVFDSYGYSRSSASQIGGDVGFPEIVKAGVNFSSTHTHAYSGSWVGGDGEIRGLLSFENVDHPELGSDPDREPFYFKQAGEMVAIDEGFRRAVQGDSPVRLRIDEFGTAHAGLVGSDVTSALGAQTFPAVERSEPLVAPLSRTRRERRNQSISVLTAEEAEHAALQKEIQSYALGQPLGSVEPRGIPRNAEHRKAHHISEITVYRPDGSRYVFGIPAYNLYQKEVTFNATGLPHDCATGLVTYDPKAHHNTPENELGRDHFYSATELPPYAHTYLLTAVLSPDFVDREGDGPTPDDLGSYTRLNYTQVYGREAGGAASGDAGGGDAGGYRWRVPFAENQASYSEGLKADPDDDKASYLYGEKEVWYLHSVESKTHVAEVELGRRDDSCGVAGENGGWDPAMDLRRLDRITLYSRWDRYTRGEEAVPIKSVHFRYDHSLASPVPNFRRSSTAAADARGKLTLREVYFTYQDSFKGERSPYRFRYSDVNPPYHLKGYDRWGYYKPNEATSCDVATSALSNGDLPYAEQDPARADELASAWHLTEIRVPSGGRIGIEYEADRYGFVQDRKAMRMMAVTALGKDDMLADRGPADAQLFENDALSTAENRLYLGVELPGIERPGEIPGGDAAIRDVLERSLRDEEGKLLEDLHFRFLVDVTGEGGWEFVSGWADLEDWGVTAGRPWIRLRAVPLEDREGPEAHPISKAAWQMARLRLSHVIHPGSEPVGTAGEELVKALRGLLSAMGEVRNLVQGHNRVLRNRGLGRTTQLGKSFVRLYDPDHEKLGGGSRVRRIHVDDRFRDMLEQGSATADERAVADLYRSHRYGQEYSYATRLDPEDPGSPEISSGVAVYEPILGGEENPLRRPVAFTASHKLAPDDRFFHETPYGESLFPGPSVGYGRVTVRNLQPPEVRRHGTGHVEHEFYTARDFPVITRATRVDARPNKPGWLLKLLKVDIRDHMTASQGYSIELNNMHGVPEAQWVYPEPGIDADGEPRENQPISGVEYVYRTEASDEEWEALLANELAPFADDLEGRFDEPRRLSNRVVVADESGALRAATIGVETGLVADLRESGSHTSSFEMAANVDVSSLPIPVPLPIPSFWPGPTREETRFRSAVLTKVVTRYGILQKTIAHDLGSRVSTENLVWDGETGEVLVTRTENDFEDPVYSFTYPAHWGYDGMGPAYRNLGLRFEGVKIGGAGELAAVGGSRPAADHAELFVPGDEVLVAGGGSAQLLWVDEVDRVPRRIALIDRRGRPAAATTGATLRLFRSGRRNQPSTPIGTVTSLADPIGEDGGLDFEEVLNAGAVEFQEAWNGFCECGIAAEGDGGNPYVEGRLGQWRARRSHLYLTERSASHLNRNSNLRKDGTFEDFRPFWRPAAGRGWGAHPEGWQFTSEVSLFSPFGFELENVDALERPSAALYAFNQTLPTAVASNASYREIGSESFEDVDCDACGGGHLSFTTRSEDLSREEAHTGRRSVRVGPRSRISMLRQIRCETPDAERFSLSVDYDLMQACDRMGAAWVEILPFPEGGEGPYEFATRRKGPGDCDPGSGSWRKTDCTPDGRCRSALAPGQIACIRAQDAKGRNAVTEVAIPEVISVEIEVVDASCRREKDGLCTLEARPKSLFSGPFTIRWHDEDSTQSLRLKDVPADTYLVRVVNAGGCYATSEVTLELEEGRSP